MSTATPTFVSAPLSKLHAHEHNVRQGDLTDIDSLAKSIESVGLLTPLTVRLRDDGEYDIIAGHRRYAALSTIKNFGDVPVLVVNGDTPDTARMLVENLQRVDLNPVEEAEGFATLLALPTVRTQREVAKLVGFDASKVSRRLALLTLPKALLDDVRIDPSRMALAEMMLPLVKAGMSEIDLLELWWRDELDEYDINSAQADLDRTNAIEKVVKLYRSAGVGVFTERPSMVEAGFETTSDDALGHGPLDASAAAEAGVPAVYVTAFRRYDAAITVSVLPLRVIDATVHDTLDPETGKIVTGPVSTADRAKEEAKAQRAKERAEKAERIEAIQQVMAGKVPAALADELLFGLALDRVDQNSIKALCKAIDLAPRTEPLADEWEASYLSDEKRAVLAMYVDGSAATKAKAKAIVVIASDFCPAHPPRRSTALFT